MAKTLTMMIVLPAFGAGALLAAFSGCSDGGEAARARTGATPPSIAPGPQRESEGAFVSPPGFTVQQTATLANAPSSFVVDGDNVITSTTVLRRALRRAASAPDDAPSQDPQQDFRLEAAFGKDYGSGVRINISSRPGAWVDVKPVGGAAARARVRDDGAVVSFENAYPNVTAAFGANDSHVEEFLAIPTAADVPELRYQLSPGPEIGEWVQTRKGLFAFSKEGKGLLHVPRPVATDSRGQKVLGDWSLGPETADNTRTITAQLDLTGLAFPIVVDPAFDTPEWFPDSADGTVPSRGGAVGLYDSTDRCVIVWGGADASFNLLTDIWGRCNGTNSWFRVTPGTAPPTPRAYSACAWDPTVPGAWCFGGYVGTAGAPVAGDLWKGSNSAQIWAQIPKPGAATWPGPRMMHGMAWSGTRTLVFGGVDKTGAFLKDTWSWDGTNFTQVCAACFPGRYGFATARLGTESSPTIYIVGGYDGTSFTNDVWRFTGATWTQVSVAPASVPLSATGTTTGIVMTTPPNRYLAWAGRTPSNNLLWGSGVVTAGTTSFLFDAWMMSSVSPTWSLFAAPDPSQAGSDPLPGFRESGNAIYDDVQNELVIIHGWSSIQNSSVRVDARRYKGRSDSVTMTARCNDVDRDGRCATNGVDTFTLTASFTLASGAQAQGYFLSRVGSTWATATGSCGTSAAPLAGSGGGPNFTVTCTSTLVSGLQTFAVRVRDGRYYSSAAGGAGSLCRNPPNSNYGTATCDQTQMYGGVSACASFPATANATTSCP